ncbi:unnamed protein product, partial [marine sediment metagenome]
MAKISEDNILDEIEKELRNNDILTVVERNVTTDTASGTVTADPSLLINVSNIKNIRSITVGGSPITFGTDYTY